jgi:glycosyltransferase involved in cell wall biosynthesis
MPKLLIIGNDATRTGAPIGLLHVLRELKARGDYTFEILLRVGRGELRSEYESIGSVTAYDELITNRGRLRRALRKVGFRRVGPFNCLSGIEQLYVDRGIDLIYANTITNGGILADLAALKLPVVCHVHELASIIEKYGHGNLALVRRHVDRYVACSVAVRDNLVSTQGIDGERIDVIHESIPVVDMHSAVVHDAAAVRRELGVPADAPIVCGSGFTRWRKGRDLFVRIAAKMRTFTESPVHFVWVGGREDQQEMEATHRDMDRAGVRDIVHLVPHTHRPLDYFAAADVFAMTSREDPFPFVNLEAGLLEKPIVCFADGGGTPELVEDDAGFVVPHLDVAAFAEAVLKLLQDDELRKKMGSRAAEKVRERYSIEKAVDEIEKIVGTCLAKGRGKRP